MTGLMAQDGDALRMFEFSAHNDLWDTVLSATWFWTLWALLFIVLILFISVGSMNDKNFLSRALAVINGAPARNLFYKFQFRIEASEQNNVTYLRDNQPTGYLRYLDSRKAMFLTNVHLVKGQRIQFPLNTLPGFFSEEPVSLECEIRSIHELNDEGGNVEVSARIMDLSPEHRHLLDSYLQSFNEARFRRA